MFIIPTITATQKNIIDILEYVTNLTSIVHINLSPYHRIAEGKYQKLGLRNNMAGIHPPTDEDMGRYGNSLPNPAPPYTLADDGIYR